MSVGLHRRRTPSAGGAPWTPAQLASLKLLLRGDDLTQTQGQQVSTWADASGLGNDAAFLEGFLNCKENALNGMKVVESTGGFNKLSLPTNLFSGDTEGTFFILAKNNNPGNGGAPWEHIGSHGGNVHFPIAVDGDVHIGPLRTTRPNLGPASKTIAAWRINVFRSQTNDWRWDYDGENEATDSVNTFGGGATPRIGASGWPWTGEIAEVMYFNTFLSDADARRVEGYAAHKWALTASLDAGHPYKSAPPTV